MPETTRDLAKEWANLLAEREAALAEYRAALSAARENAGGPVADPERSAGRLADIKRRMDEIIAEGRNQRREQPDREHLVVVEIETREPRAVRERADDPQGVRARIAK